MEKKSEPMEQTRLENFYGRGSPLRVKYVRQRPTLNAAREADQLYSIEPLEVKNG
jgi:hypothetical protein